jgi:uncharacterized membrane protein
MSYQFIKALHVLGVVLWIGGVAFVTFILIPAIRKLDIEDQYNFFEKVEHKFAWQARFTTLLTGLTGFYLTSKYDMWSRFLDIDYWWMHAMVLVWSLFTLMLFVLEPLFLHEYFRVKSKTDSLGLMRKVQVLHWGLITVSLITVFGAVYGSH